MPVYEQKYRAYDGERTSSWRRWLALVRADLDKVVKQRAVFWSLLLVAVIFGGYMIKMWWAASQDPNIALVTEMTRSQHHRTVSADTYMGFLRYMQFYVFIIATVVGSGMVARDRAVGALTLYFSRPLSRLGYIGAKLTQLSICLALVSLVPGLLLYLGYSVVTEDWMHLWRDYPIALAIIAQSFVLILSAGLIILALSSLCQRGWIAAVVFIMLNLIGEMIGQFFSQAHWLAGVKVWQVFRDLCCLSSLQHNWWQMSSHCFDHPPALRTHWGWSLAVLVAACLLCLAVLYRRLRPVEVVR